MTWYLIWELIFNLLGELTLFADRGFYGDWWNSTVCRDYQLLFFFPSCICDHLLIWVYI